MSRRLVYLLPVLVTACAHGLIEGTRVPDTRENREIVTMLDHMREAMVTRNADLLIGMISTSYFEDNGTIDPKDDFGYEQLRTQILPDSLKVAQEVHLTFELHDVVVEGDKAHADIRYNSRALLKLPAGDLWDSHREFNRIDFVRENGAWRIISGL